MRRSTWAVVVVSGLIAIGPLQAAENNNARGTAKLEPVTDASYAKECGACHFAYLPGLLPARSWDKLLDGLADHFGDNAELDSTMVAELRGYLASHAAEHSNSRRAQRIIDSLAAGVTPLRITEVPYIQRRHHELKPRHVKDNPKVQSLSRCDACHTKADQGSFAESDIVIPGFGRWD